MDMKRLMTGSIVGGIVMMGLGYLIWEVLFATYFAAWDNDNARIWWAAAAGSVVMAALLTMWLDKSGASDWMGAAKSTYSPGRNPPGVDLLLIGSAIRTLPSSTARSLLRLPLSNNV